MYKFLLTAALLVLLDLAAAAQNPDVNSYRIYKADGTDATLSEIIRAAEKVDAIFLGENHDDATAHYLQAEIFKQIYGSYSKNRKIVLSLEMFERDVQTILDEYLTDLITEKKFLDDSRPWQNYKNDYRPLVEFAKQNKLPVAAANAPRRYVNMISRNGRAALEKLSPEAKRWLAPLNYAAASAEYSKKFNALMGNMKSETNAPSKILEAQTLWDATMAFSIAERLKREKKTLVVHLNGSFHTENRLGTVEQLQKFQPDAKILVITMRSEEDFGKFDAARHSGLGDYVILTDAKIPRSYQ